MCKDIHEKVFLHFVLSDLIYLKTEVFLGKNQLLSGTTINLDLLKDFEDVLYHRLEAPSNFVAPPEAMRLSYRGTIQDGFKNIFKSLNFRTNNIFHPINFNPSLVCSSVQRKWRSIRSGCGQRRKFSNNGKVALHKSICFSGSSWKTKISNTKQATAYESIFF